MAGARSGAKNGNRFAAKYIVRRGQEWDKPQSGKFRVNPEIFKTPEERAAYIESTAAATHRVAADDVVCLTFRSVELGESYSLPVDKLNQRMEPDEEQQTIPVPDADTIAAMSAASVLEAAKLFGLTDPAKFNDTLTTDELQANLTTALHG